MERAVDAGIRLGRAWKALSRERRLAAIAAAVLWTALFLPWYQASVVIRNPRTRNAIPVSESLNGWAAFGIVQALILIVSVGILVLLFLRAEGRGELPGGDGWTITGAGALSVLLIIVGLFNAPSPAVHSGYVVSTGLQWGIFLALLAAGGLTWAGGRIRNSLQDDPFLAGNRRGAAPAPAPPESDRESEPEAHAGAPGEPDPHAGPPREPRPPRPAPVRAAGPAPDPAPPDPDPSDEPTRVAGAAAPLTAAAVRSESAHPRAVPADARAVAPAGPDRHEEPTQPRSPWRPAERPAWTDPERPVGWLTRRDPPRAEDQRDE
jgi:hypothetical protein